jgi:hypothetical protein
LSEAALQVTIGPYVDEIQAARAGRVLYKHAVANLDQLRCASPAGAQPQPRSAGGSLSCRHTRPFSAAMRCA